MRLVFVHGMRQEGKDRDALKAAWNDALQHSWARLGLPKPDYQPELPFYGDTLDELTRAVRGAGDVVARGGEGGPTLAPSEDLLLREYQKTIGISDDAVRSELSSEVVARGPANWEWVQAIARVLEKVPGFGELGLKFVVQVDAYLDRPHIQKAVDDIVRPAFEKGPCVVVSHSLGTIVTYRLLTQLAGNATIPLLTTLGSPLGIDTVKKRLRPPKLGKPSGVARWVNGTDERDYVALHAKLTESTFCDGIENIDDIHNSKADAHSITDYLSNDEVARLIHAALT